jgi:hypothetical protein
MKRFGDYYRRRDEDIARLKNNITPRAVEAMLNDLAERQEFIMKNTCVHSVEENAILDKSLVELWEEELEKKLNKQQ